MGDIDFEVISDKLKKTRFWKEKSVEDVVLTLGPTAGATLVYIVRA